MLELSSSLFRICACLKVLLDSWLVTPGTFEEGLNYHTRPSHPSYEQLAVPRQRTYHPDPRETAGSEEFGLCGTLMCVFRWQTDSKLVTHMAFEEREGERLKYKTQPSHPPYEQVADNTM